MRKLTNILTVRLWASSRKQDVYLIGRLQQRLVLGVTRENAQGQGGPEGSLVQSRVLTNHPAERQDTWVLVNYLQANL